LADVLGAVIADRFDRATFLGFLAQRFLLRSLRLLEDERVAAVFVPGEIARRRFTAEIAVDALVIDVKLSRDVLGIFVCNVSHKSGQ
jgi:hypothetical protein